MKDTDIIQRDYWETDQVDRRSPDHPSVVALFAPRARFLAGLLPDARSASVLDVGCGNGFLSISLQNHFGRTVGLDFSAAMLARYPGRGKVRATAVQIPFADNSFDIVVCSHLLHHLSCSDRLTTIREMNRVSRTAVVLYEPNRNNPMMFAFGLIKREERMSLQFSRRYVHNLIQEAGLARCTARIEGTVLPNKMPAFLAPVGSAVGRTPLRVLGFYIRALGWKR